MMEPWNVLDEETIAIDMMDQFQKKLSEYGYRTWRWCLPTHVHGSLPNRPKLLVCNVVLALGKSSTKSFDM